MHEKTFVNGTVSHQGPYMIVHQSFQYARTKTVAVTCEVTRA